MAISMGFSTIALADPHKGRHDNRGGPHGKHKGNGHRGGQANISTTMSMNGTSTNAALTVASTFEVSGLTTVGIAVTASRRNTEAAST